MDQLSPKKSNLKKSKKTSQYSVLIIEDSCLQAQVYLDNMGSSLKVDWENNLKKGIKKLQNKKYDCILLDLNLPDSKNLEALEKIAVYSKDVPIVVVTSTYDDRNSVRKAFRLGAHDFLLKSEINNINIDEFVKSTIKAYQLEMKNIQEQAENKIRSLLEGKDGRDKLFQQYAPLICHSIIETMNEGVISFSQDGHVIFANQQMVSILGFNSSAKVANKLIDSFIPASSIQNNQANRTTCYSSKTSSSFESELINRSGDIVPVLIHQTPLLDHHHNITSIFWVVTDLSELKEKEALLKEQMRFLEKANDELKKIDKVKSNFLSMVSHELRTPLASIKEGVAIVADKTCGPLNEKQEKFLGIASKNASRLAHLINDLLDLAKMESGKLKLIKNSHDVSLIIRESVEELEPIAKKQAVDISIKISKKLPRVLIDSDKIHEVMTNLISNALKYADNNDRITVRSVRYKEDPNFVIIKVIDKGPGIAPDDLEKIFHKFQQLEDTSTRKKGGTGLGLPICRDIIELHGGRIWVESKQSKGSTFSFTLPIEGGKVMERKKILVIDDEEDICETAKARLEASNMDVQTALNGPEGIKKAISFKPDFILLDLMMPEMDGFQVCENLKKNKLTKSIPVVVLTCLEDEEAAKKVISKGANGYMVKPFDKDSLLYTIKEFLRSSNDQ